MNLLRQRTLCKICSVLLLTGFLLLRLPYALTLGLALALLALLLPARRKPTALLTLLLLFALCLSILATEWHPRAVLSRTERGDILEMTVAGEDRYGRTIAVSLKRNGVPCPFSRVILYSDEALSVGDRVTVSVGSVSVFDPGEDTSASVRADRLISREEHPYSARALFASLRGALSRRLDAIGGEELGALLSALLLGETGELSLATSSAFRRLGLSHVLAISGMHLLLLASLLLRLLTLARIPRPIRSLLCSVFLVLYAMMVGGTPSILRALCMALVSEAAFFVGRRADSLTSLFFSGGALAIIMPRILLSLSFQLSFLATFGVISCARVLRRLAFAERFSRPLYRFVIFPSAMSLFALVFTLPLTLSGFGQLSLAALPANLLLTPFYELLLSLGLLSLCIGPILPIRVLVKGLGLALLTFTEWVAQIPMLLLDASHPILILLFTLFALLFLFHLLRLKTTKRAVALTLIPTLVLLSVTLALLAIPRHGSREMTIHSNGESGEIIVLKTGRDRALIDLSAGDRPLLDKTEKQLSRDAVTELSLYLPAEYGENSLSALMRVTKRYLVRLVLLPEARSEGESSVKASLTDYLSREGIPYRTLENGEHTLGDYRLCLQRLAEAALLLEICCAGERVCYLSGAAAGLLHYREIPSADHLILGSRGAAASRLPDTSRYAPHLVLCSRVFPEIYHSGRVTRISGSLSLTLSK